MCNPRKLQFLITLTQGIAMSAQKYLSYTYLIGWSKEDLWYYGCRWANKTEPEDDLWVHYFTSSKYVKETRKQYGEPDVIQIRQKFLSKKEAPIWESKVLTRMKVIESDRWLNRNNRNAPPISLGHSHPMFGKTHSEKTRKKMSISHTGKKLSEYTKQKLSKQRQAEDNPFYGKTHTTKIKQKIRQTHTGESNYQFKGYYITPWGNFASSTVAAQKCPFNVGHSSIQLWCRKNNHKIISKGSITRSPYLTINMLGQTYHDVGFDFLKSR